MLTLFRRRHSRVSVCVLLCVCVCVERKRKEDEWHWCAHLCMRSRFSWIFGHSFADIFPINFNVFVMHVLVGCAGLSLLRLMCVYVYGTEWCRVISMACWCTPFAQSLYQLSRREILPGSHAHNSRNRNTFCSFTEIEMYLWQKFALSKRPRNGPNREKCTKVGMMHAPFSVQHWQEINSTVPFLSFV